MLLVVQTHAHENRCPFDGREELESKSVLQNQADNMLN